MKFSEIPEILDTSSLALTLFGRPVEKALTRAASGALSARLTGMDFPLGIPARSGETALPSGSFRKALRKWVPKMLRGAAYAHAWYVLAVAVLLFVYRTVDPPVTVLMAYRAVRDGWDLAAQRSVSLDGFPALARRMVVSVEDGRFFQHSGIDLDAIRYALKVNRQIGRALYGGSTLTMQTARTLFLVPYKSYFRKYLELIAALEMEMILSKERILEIYLSWAEWGKGVFGMEAAARRFYGKSVSRLDLDQTARLVSLLSSPIRYTPATIEKNGILRSRYQYLIRKYGPPPAAAASPPADPAATAAGNPENQPAGT